MSYYKAKSISIKGDKIFMSVADSSITPTTYYTTEYMETSNKDIDEKLILNLVMLIIIVA